MMEKLKTPSRPQYLTCDVEMQNMNPKCKIPEFFMRFLKEVVYLKVTDVNSFLVVKEM